MKAECGASFEEYGDPLCQDTETVGKTQNADSSPRIVLCPCFDKLEDAIERYVAKARRVA